MRKVSYEYGWSGRKLAQSLLSHAILTGRIERKCCEVCGKEKTDGHHKNYWKPLKITWLCRKHHKEIHRQLTLRKKFYDKTKDYELFLFLRENYLGKKVIHKYNNL